MIRSGGGGLTRQEALSRVRELKQKSFSCEADEMEAICNEQRNLQYSLGLSEKEMKEACDIETFVFISDLLA